MNADIHVFGKEDSVKETYQGFLSRSIPARRRHGLRSRPLSSKKKRHAAACLFFLCELNTMDQRYWALFYPNSFFCLSLFFLVFFHKRYYFILNAGTE